MPQDHRRDAQQMADDDASHAKMSEQDDGVMVGADGPVVPSFPLIAVGGEELVEMGGHIGVFFLHMSLDHGIRGTPGILVIKTRFLCPVCREPVPGDRFLFKVWKLDIGGEFF